MNSFLLKNDETEFKMLKKRIDVACKRIKADLVIKNSKIVNVFTMKIDEGFDIAVSGGIIAGIGKNYFGFDTLDAKGKFVVPGLIDAHVHIESSMTIPPVFAESVAYKGTTAVIADPHEIVNVFGKKGFEFMYDFSENPFLDIFWMLPSCVPATNFETSGGIFGIEEMNSLMNSKNVIGLGEMMNFPGIINGDNEVLKKVALFRNKIIDGHAPFVSNSQLQAYAGCGISSDHECTNVEEMIEKISSGMFIMIREGSAGRNLRKLVRGITPQILSRVSFCTDDRHPEDIINEGHINYLLKIAVEEGLNPISAIVMATRNPAEYFGLRKLGSVSPGKNCDLFLCSDLISFTPDIVLKKGNIIFNNGVNTIEPQIYNISPEFLDSINTNYIEQDMLKIIGKGNARAIDVKDGELITGEKQFFYDSESSLLENMNYISVINRYKEKCIPSNGVVNGLSLKKVAIAMSIAHDSHNIVCSGDNHYLMAEAINEVIKIKGGIAVVSMDKRILVPLIAGGLMSVDSMGKVCNKLKEIKDFMVLSGCGVKDILLTLSFLSLPVIPSLKITDLGLVDVNSFKFVNFFVE